MGHVDCQKERNIPHMLIMHLILTGNLHQNRSKGSCHLHYIVIQHPDELLHS